MIPDSRKNMQDACHALAEHILRLPAHTNRCKWLKQQVARDLAAKSMVDNYDRQYRHEYPYADAPTEYLASVLKAYDDEGEVA